MSGITTTCNTKNKASLRLANELRTYLFEQQYEEIEFISPGDLSKLKGALKILVKLVNKGIKS